MTIPSEFIIWALGANGLFLSFCVHLLVRLNANLGKICTAHEVSQSKTDLRLSAMDQQVNRNRADIDLMRRNLRISEVPHMRQGENHS